MRENLRAVRIRVGGNIRRLRLARGLSQEQFAELVGNSGKHIGLVERGEVNVGIDTLTNIAQALSADVSDLFLKPSGRRRPARSFVITERQLTDVEETFRAIRAARPSRSRRSGD